MAAIECPNCGSTLYETDRFCPYCGAKNPSYSGPESKKSNARPVTPPPAQTQPQSIQAPVVVKKSGINIIAFIILLILFWPAAIIYLVVKLAS